VWLGCSSIANTFSSSNMTLHTQHSTLGSVSFYVVYMYMYIYIPWWKESFIMHGSMLINSEPCKLSITFKEIFWIRIHPPGHFAVERGSAIVFTMKVGRVLVC
jgi:hypothetical protein